MKIWSHTPSASGSYGNLAGRQAVRRNKGRFEIFWNPLLIALLGILQRFTKVQCYCSVTNAIQSFYSGNAYCEACCGSTKKWDAMFFSCLSLLLSTTMLNDSPRKFNVITCALGFAALTFRRCRPRTLCIYIRQIPCAQGQILDFKRGYLNIEVISKAGGLMGTAPEATWYFLLI